MIRAFGDEPSANARELGAASPASASAVGERWAIVVGISKYRDASLDLDFADRDAREFSAFIQSPEGGGFKPENVAVLINDKATTDNVTRALRTFLKKPDRDDLVIIYFACHGAPDPDRPGNVYLLTHDVDPTDIAGTPDPMPEVDLSLRESLHARHVVILADTCHSAAIGGGPGTRAVSGAAAVNAYLKGLSETRGGVALLTSAEANEVSLEGAQWGGGHGVFTHFLLEGMRGAADMSPKNGVVTVGELFEYVRENVKKATNHRQHPAIGTTRYDRGLPMAIPGLLVHVNEADGGVGVEPPRAAIARVESDAGVRWQLSRRSRALSLAGAALLVVLVVAGMIYRKSQLRRTSVTVQVLEFLRARGTATERLDLAAWLQQQLAGALVDSGWNVVSRGVTEAQGVERRLAVAGELDSSTALPGEGVQSTHTVGGIFQVVARDSVGVEAHLVDVRSGRVIRSGGLRTSISKLRETIDILAHQLLHGASLEVPPESAREPLARASSLRHYVNGVVWLGRDQVLDARESFRQASREDSTFVPAATALRVATMFDENAEPTIGVDRFLNAGAPIRRDSVAGLSSLANGLPDLLMSSVASGGGRVVERERLPELRKEVQSQRGKGETAGRIGRLLGTRYWVTGSYMLLGNEWVLDVQLSDLESGLTKERFSVRAPYDSLFEAAEELGLRLSATISILPPVGSLEALDSLRRFQTRLGLPVREAAPKR